MFNTQEMPALGLEILQEFSSVNVFPNFLLANLILEFQLFRNVKDVLLVQGYP